MKNLNILTAVILLAGLGSCNSRDEFFEREQYKNVFALISDDGYNIFAVVHDLNEVESTGYVAASCGGSNPTKRELDITLEPSPEAIDFYNKSNFDVEIAKYANILSPEKYTIDSYHFTIGAGEVKGRMPIKVRPDGLSPDSVYFIPLKIGAFSTFEVNPTKSDILYRVLIKNKYATQESITNYNLRGVSQGVNIVGQKRMHPISSNKVRIMAGTESFEADVDVINRVGLILEINADNHVTISPVKNLTVTQINDDPDYPNVFEITDDGYRTFKTFLLRYDYKLGANTIQMREELRLEFKEEQK
jgi:hypothetical protein